MTWFSWLNAATSGTASSRLGAIRGATSASHAAAIRAGLANHKTARRAGLTYAEAVELICTATGWPVGHLWVRGAEGWESSGAWHDGGAQFGDLKASTSETSLGSGRGIVAAVLHLEACRFLPGLEGLGSEVRLRHAAALGLTAVVGVPMRRGGTIEAVFEFITATYVEPDGTLTDALLAVAARTRRHIPVPTRPPTRASTRRTVSLDPQVGVNLAIVDPTETPAAPSRHDSTAR